jgi:hypothetical protein
MNYIGGDDLVAYTDESGGVYSGGFNVKSVLMKLGISPIVTLNHQTKRSNTDKVSELFENLAIPNWAIAYKNLHSGSEENIGKNYYGGRNESGVENDEEVVDDDLYNTLLGLVEVDKDGNDISEKDEIKGGGKHKKKTKRLLKLKKTNKKTKKQL